MSVNDLADTLECIARVFEACRLIPCPRAPRGASEPSQRLVAALDCKINCHSDYFDPYQRILRYFVTSNLCI